ncbi:pentapeptide repeat-containing protein [Gelidibacter japonicus]|uniref:pentapeptide repeat-containing protein n=1 Tax=Gelidibacter japonicus TaxID=1962232 RepID=UPI0013D149A7|nr:pentapeptide repeat-containing protein [Gelidibacter japonicus]
MSGNYSNKNLQKSSFRNEKLSDVSFSGSDLRGADFSNADLSGADFTNVRTGITTLNAVLLFIGALIVSLFAGYLATLVASTLRGLYESNDAEVRIGGIVATALIIVFIFYALWKGGAKSIYHLIVPAVVLSLMSSLIIYLTGLGSGINMLYVGLAFFILLIMFYVGTIARTAAGSLSNILFLLVAVSGGVISKHLGGGIGTTILAIACALISKRALAGTTGFEHLKKIANFITKKLGTSFRNSNLSGANFSGANIHNTDFSGADTSSVNWENSKKVHSIEESPARIVH